MTRMNQKELNEILEQHKIWLTTGGEKGEYADLFEADLRGAKQNNTKKSHRMGT